MPLDTSTINELTCQIRTCNMHRNLAELITTLKGGFKSRNLRLGEQLDALNRKYGLAFHSVDKPLNEAASYELKFLKNGERKDGIPLFVAWMLEHHPHDERVAVFIEAVKLRNRERIDKELARNQRDSASSVELSGEYRDLADEFDSRTASLVEFYEPSEIENDFRELFETSDSGYWYVSAGPGVGKSGLLAHTAVTYGERGVPVLAHFFMHSQWRSKWNNVEGCFKFLLANLRALFSFAGTDEREDDSPEAFWIALRTLCTDHRVSADRKLIIVIDAIDEMDPSPLTAAPDTHPLLLAPILPPGVFVVFSSRPSEKQLLWKAESTPSLHTHIAADTAPDFARHEQAARRYTERMCEAHKFITPYWRNGRRQTNERERSTFVDLICRKSEANFMVLRSVLHNDKYWRNGGNGVELTGDLEKFYAIQLERMIRDETDEVVERSPYCFSLRPSISRFALIRMLVGNASDRAATVIASRVANWQAQGLIVAHHRHGNDWLSPYHFTYRSFLFEQFAEVDRSRFLRPLIDHMLEVTPADSNLSAMEDETDDIRHEWIYLLMMLLVRSETLASLERLASNIDFWRFALDTDDGLNAFLYHLEKIRPRGRSARAWQSLLARLADRVFAWTESDVLRDSGGEACSLDTIQEVLANSNPGKGSRNVLNFSDFLNAKLR